MPGCTITVGVRNCAVLKSSAVEIVNAPVEPGRSQHHPAYRCSIEKLPFFLAMLQQPFNYHATVPTRGDYLAISRWWAGKSCKNKLFS